MTITTYQKTERLAAWFGASINQGSKTMSNAMERLPVVEYNVIVPPDILPQPNRDNEQRPSPRFRHRRSRHRSNCHAAAIGESVSKSGAAYSRRIAR
jgi:hypothetical protein